MIQNKMKAIFGMVLLVSCFGLFSFTSNESANNSAAIDSAAGGPKVTCPAGDFWICYTIQGGHVWKGRGDATVEY